MIDRDGVNLVNPLLRVTSKNDEAFGYLERVIVTPAVYPRLFELHRFNIQSTGQTSHCVNTIWRPSQYSRIPLVRSSSELIVHRTRKASKSISLSINCHKNVNPLDTAKRQAASEQLKS